MPVKLHREMLLFRWTLVLITLSAEGAMLRTLADLAVPACPCPCPLGPNRDATSTSRRPNTQIGAVSHDVVGMRGCMHGAKTGVGREKCRLYQAEPGAIGEVGLPEPSLPSRIRTSIALLSPPFAELVCLSSLVLCRSCWCSWRSCAFFFFSSLHRPCRVLPGQLLLASYFSYDSHCPRERSKKFKSSHTIIQGYVL